MNLTQNYRLPAEWEPQEAVWLVWPQNRETWGAFLPEIEKTYYSICHAILEYEPVYLLGDNQALLNTVGQKMQKRHAHEKHIVRAPTNDCWIRDYGGMTVISKTTGESRRSVLNWKFNSWGGKYPPWDDDDKIPDVMAGAHHAERIDIDMVMEGGSIEVNGKGKLLTTEQCLLGAGRNPGISRPQLEALLFRYLGAEEFIWLQGGIEGDDTDGHVDNLARFVNETTLFCAIEESAFRCNFQALKKNQRILESSASRMGMDLIEVPLPAPVFVDEVRTPASYMNFLIINGAVLVPVFADARDEKTLCLFEQHFPGRRIVPVDCRSLSYGLGGLHCITMQVPA
ncbi:agmatine/peptidylarginine deiminase [Fibrobacterota bacterium]